MWAYELVFAFCISAQQMFLLRLWNGSTSPFLRQQVNLMCWKLPFKLHEHESHFMCLPPCMYGSSNYPVRHVGRWHGGRKEIWSSYWKNTDQICRQLGALILKNCLRSKRTNLERFASSLEKFAVTFSYREHYWFYVKTEIRYFFWGTLSIPKRSRESIDF